MLDPSHIAFRTGAFHQAGANGQDTKVDALHSALTLDAAPENESEQIVFADLLNPQVGHAVSQIDETRRQVVSKESIDVAVNVGGESPATRREGGEQSQLLALNSPILPAVQPVLPLTPTSITELQNLAGPDRIDRPEETLEGIQTSPTTQFPVAAPLATSRAGTPISDSHSPIKDVAIRSVAPLPAAQQTTGTVSIESSTSQRKIVRPAANALSENRTPSISPIQNRRLATSPRKQSETPMSADPPGETLRSAPVSPETLRDDRTRPMVVSNADPADSSNDRAVNANRNQATSQPRETLPDDPIRPMVVSNTDPLDSSNDRAVHANRNQVTSQPRETLPTNQAKPEFESHTSTVDSKRSSSSAATTSPPVFLVQNSIHEQHSQRQLPIDADKQTSRAEIAASPRQPTKTNEVTTGPVVEAPDRASTELYISSHPQDSDLAVSTYQVSPLNQAAPSELPTSTSDELRQTPTLVHAASETAKTSEIEVDTRQLMFSSPDASASAAIVSTGEISNQVQNPPNNRPVRSDSRRDSVERVAPTPIAGAIVRETSPAGLTQPSVNAVSHDEFEIAAPALEQNPLLHSIEETNSVYELPDSVRTSLTSAYPATHSEPVVSPSAVGKVETSIPTPQQVSISNQVSAAVAHLAQTSDEPGVHSISLELQPAELGHLRIQVEQTAESITTMIVASELLSTELLSNQRESLLSALADLGYENTDLDISFGGQHSDETQDQFERGQPSASESAPANDPIEKKPSINDGVSIVA